MKSTKKPDKWKKHSVSIIVLATLFGRNLSSSDFSSSLSYLSRKKGTSETFLSLSLFISRPRPTASASKIRLRLRKTFPQFPFFYFGNLEKLKSDEDKFFLRVASTIIETKYYCIVYLLPTMVGRGLGSIHGWANGSLSKFPEILFLLIKGISELNAYTLSNYMCPTVFPIPEKWEKLGAFWLVLTAFPIHAKWEKLW